jgi:hypothetical protein
MEHGSFDAWIRQLGTTRLTRSHALRGLFAGAMGIVAGAALLADEGVAKHKSNKQGGRTHARAQKADAGKVTICHFTHSAKNPYEIISVSANNLDAHEKHGDFAVDPDDPNHCCIDSDCDNGDTCDTATGTCQGVCANPGSLPDGAECVSSTECNTCCCVHRINSQQISGRCGLVQNPQREECSRRTG